MMPGGKNLPPSGGRGSQSYLVSLLPRKIIDELGLDVQLWRRRISSYTPVEDDGLLVDTADENRTAESFARISGGSEDFAAWQFYEMTGQVAQRVFPTLTEPLPTKRGPARGCSAAHRRRGHGHRP